MRVTLFLFIPSISNTAIAGSRARLRARLVIQNPLWKIVTMAAEFIGYNVLVSLQVPPGGKLQGQVADVIGQKLMLRDGE